MFVAGGTGGHINPALAAAGELRARDKNTEILFVGTPDKMEARLVPAAGYAFKTIKMSGFQRKPSLENLKRNLGTLKNLAFATKRSKKLIEDFKPDVVVGFGGYVTGPVVRTAAKMGIKTAIHEQNAFPGVTNKALAKMADSVMLTVPQAEKYLECRNAPVVTGLPVRGELLEADRDFSRAQLKLDNRPLILSMGGSLGAMSINNAIVELIAARHEKKDCHYIHATGQYGLWVPDELKKRGVDVEGNPDITIREYIDDMARCLSAADLVIGRAGASSLSEIEALGKASILIPSPNVAENHQYHNAMALVENGAAVIIEEKELTPERIISEVETLLADANALARLGENAKKLSVSDAQKKIADIITELAQQK